MEKKKKFLEILKIELMDAKSDIDLFLEHLDHDHEKGAISNYVFYANRGTYKNELIGLEDVLHTLDEINAEDYETLDALAEGVKDSFEKQFKEHGLVKAGFILVSNKVDRVLGYMNDDIIC